MGWRMMMIIQMLVIDAVCSGASEHHASHGRPCVRFLYLQCVICSSTCAALLRRLPFLCLLDCPRFSALFLPVPLLQPSDPFPIIETLWVSIEGRRLCRCKDGKWMRLGIEHPLRQRQCGLIIEEQIQILERLTQPKGLLSSAMSQGWAQA